MTNTPQNVYWTTVEYHTWTLYLAATSKGLCCLTLPSESFDTLVNWVDLHIPHARLVEDREALAVIPAEAISPRISQGRANRLYLPAGFSRNGISSLRLASSDPYSLWGDM